MSPTATVPSPHAELEIYHDSTVEVCDGAVLLDGHEVAVFGRTEDADHYALSIQRGIRRKLRENGVRSATIPVPLSMGILRVQWHVPAEQFDQLLQALAPGKPTRTIDDDNPFRVVDLAVSGCAITMYEAVASTVEHDARAEAVASS